MPEDLKLNVVNHKTFNTLQVLEMGLLRFSKGYVKVTFTRSRIVGAPLLIPLSYFVNCLKLNLF